MKTHADFEGLTTQRLILREIETSDVDQIFRLRSDEEMMRYIPRPLCKDKNDALKLIKIIRKGFINGENVNWGICLKNSQTLIGTVGFVRMALEHNQAEIGYMLDKAYYKQGIMQEAVEAVLNYGFKRMHLHRIEAVIDPGNTASEKLLQKFGFLKEGHHRENFLFNGQYLDSVDYALIK